MCRTCQEAEQAAQRSDPRRQSAALHEALGLWRGEPLVDVPSQQLRRDRVGRLREQRLSAVEQRIEADLPLASGNDLVDELTAHPSRAAGEPGVVVERRTAATTCGAAAHPAPMANTCIRPPGVTGGNVTA